MRKFVLSLLCLGCTMICFAQPDRMQIADSISKEGERFFMSQSASWFGTDAFLEKCQSRVENIGGYFSYDNNGDYTCFLRQDIQQ